MLNITNNIIADENDLQGLKSREQLFITQKHISFRNLLLVLLLVFVVFMFLPWTQNVRGNGQLTALRPEQRPQTIHATISGRIERWYIMEGQEVKKGDTIVYISEVKSEYFDPRLVERTGNQVTAKEGAIASYQGKAGALTDQIAAMNREMKNKFEQIVNKVEQKQLKVVSDSIFVLQEENDVKIATRQFDGIKVLYEKGIEPLTKFEERRLKLVDAQTKLIKARNDLDISKNDLTNARIEYQLTQNEFANKIAKSQSERFSTLSDQFDSEASVNKLRTEQENYRRRSGYYYITAPQDGYIIKALAPGIGEILKEGAPVVSILPAGAELAVEMYVKPIDIPLLQTGSTVRFMFDGWPAFFFSGWPGLSLGTYAGDVVAIDRNISEGGKFRVLVAPSSTEAPWPEALRVGGGAKGIALLNDVPLWYELWRMLNGFPPDMYNSAAAGAAQKPKK
jgi:multidrug resistance efflux pump